MVRTNSRYPSSMRMSASNTRVGGTVDQAYLRSKPGMRYTARRTRLDAAMTFFWGASLSRVLSRRSRSSGSLMKRTTLTMATGTKSRPMYSHASQNLKVPAGKNSMHPIRKKPARKRVRVIESNAVRERGLGFIRRSLSR